MQDQNWLSILGALSAMGMLVVSVAAEQPRLRRTARLALVVAVMAALGLAACDWPALGPTVIVQQTQTVGQPAPSSSPTAGVCAAADRVDAAVIGGAVVRVGSVERLDATVYVGGVELAPGNPCTQSKTLTWAAFSGPCAFVGSASGYNPEFSCSAAGSASTSVSVDGKSASVSVRAQ